MALVSQEDKAHRHPGIPTLMGQLWPCHSPSPHPHTPRVPPTPGHWDPCSTEALEVSDPKTNRTTKVLGGSPQGGTS